MTEDVAYALMERMYNTFGKSVPKQNSGQFQVLFENVQNVPDVCAKYIARKMSDLDSMPQNLSKFFWTCWESWKLDNPDQLTREACPECGGTGGVAYFRCFPKPNGKSKWIECFSPCPQCTWIPQRLKEKVRPFCYTKRELEEKARRDSTYVLLPEEYKGNTALFRLQMQIDPLPPNPYFPSWLEGFRQRFREGKAAMNAKAKPAEYDPEAVQ